MNLNQALTQKLQNHLLFIRKKEINDHNIPVIKGPEKPEFSPELFLEAEKFYLYFSNESAAQQAAPTRLGELHV